MDKMTTLYALYVNGTKRPTLMGPYKDQIEKYAERAYEGTNLEWWVVPIDLPTSLLERKDDA